MNPEIFIDGKTAVPAMAILDYRTVGDRACIALVNVLANR